MTTPLCNSNGDAVPAGWSVAAEQFAQRTCRLAVDGRRAARLLAGWCKRFGLSEPEFQVLWCLRSAADRGFDQKTVAVQLALSPAQVSGTVERLRERGCIALRARRGDRRRNFWQLTVGGHALVQQMLAEVEGQLKERDAGRRSRQPIPPAPKEAA